MKRKTPLVSPWCVNLFHRKCSHHMQRANDHRPDLFCACACHV